ncbi:MAG: flagellar biosynthetic protein FliO [Defluviitaleaceae bacterium]|nr:flagellar biosynthetic protein FliO [Defluviitaleaceae bacterium]
MENFISLLANWPTSNTVGRVFYIIILFAFVTLLAYYTTKLIARSRRGNLRFAKRNLEVLESIGLGAQAMAQIVRAGDAYYLIGVTKENVSVLACLNKDGLALKDADSAASDLAFGEMFRRFVSRGKNGRDSSAEGDGRDG